jgi:hypothetical protein
MLVSTFKAIKHRYISCQNKVKKYDEPKELDKDKCKNIGNEGTTMIVEEVSVDNSRTELVIKKSEF